MPDPKKAATAILDSTPLFDEVVRHAVDIEALKNLLRKQAVERFDREVVEEIIDRLSVSLPKIRNRGHLSQVQGQKNVASLLLAVREIARGGLKNVVAELGVELKKVAVMEAKVAIKQIAGAVPIRVDFKTPSPQVLVSSINSKPMQGQFLKDWAKGVENNTVKAVERQIRIGLAEGKSTPQITRALRGTKEAGYTDAVLYGPRNQVETIVRTSVNHVVTDAREQAFAANSDVIEGVKIVAVLDSRTTFICMAEDQQVYPIGQGPRPPLHFNCRSTTVPVIDFKKLGIPFEPPVGKRAALGANGGETVSAKLDYPAWFSRQPATWQRDVLGPGRYDLYKRGVHLADMKDLAGRRLSIEQISKRAGLN